MMIFCRLDGAVVEKFVVSDNLNMKNNVTKAEAAAMLIL